MSLPQEQTQYSLLIEDHTQTINSLITTKTKLAELKFTLDLKKAEFFSSLEDIKYLGSNEETRRLAILQHFKSEFTEIYSTEQELVKYELLLRNLDFILEIHKLKHIKT